MSSRSIHNLVFPLFLKTYFLQWDLLPRKEPPKDHSFATHRLSNCPRKFWPSSRRENPFGNSRHGCQAILKEKNIKLYQNAINRPKILKERTIYTMMWQHSIVLINENKDLTLSKTAKIQHYKSSILNPQKNCPVLLGLPRKRYQIQTFFARKKVSVIIEEQKNNLFMRLEAWKDRQITPGL